MPALFIPSDGRLTSQNSLTGTLTGGEVMYIVSPGNPGQGISYQVTTNVLATFFSAYPFLNTEIITAGSTYNVAPTDTRILVNKTLSSPTSIIFPAVSSMVYPFSIVVKDMKGDADVNPITITFSSGQLCDGLASITLDTSYQWVTINPVPNGNSWYMT